MKSLHNQLEWCNKVQWLLGLALTLLLAGFVLFGYRPTSRRLADLQMQIDNKRRDLTSNLARVKILPDVIATVTDLRTKLEKFDKQLPKQQEIPQFLKDIDAMVRNASLRGVAVEPALLPLHSELYSEIPVSMKFKGDFLSVFSFLRQTEEMQRLTRVKDLKLKSDDRSSKPGQVEVELSMNIYFSEG